MCCLLHGRCTANTITLNAFSQMPASNTTLLLSSADPIFGNDGLVSNLAQQGVTIRNLDGTPLSGMSEYVKPPFAAPTSPIAPSVHGSSKREQNRREVRGICRFHQ